MVEPVLERNISKFGTGPHFSISEETLSTSLIEKSRREGGVVIESNPGSSVEPLRLLPTLGSDWSRSVSTNASRVFPSLLPLGFNPQGGQEGKPPTVSYSVSLQTKLSL